MLCWFLYACINHCARAVKRDSASASPVPGTFSLAKDGDAQDAQEKAQAQDGNRDQISAADYDPNLDRREDERKIVFGSNEDVNDVEMIEEEEDDDVDDMFALDTAEKEVKKVKKVVVSRCNCSFRYILIPCTEEACSACTDHNDIRFRCGS